MKTMKNTKNSSTMGNVSTLHAYLTPQHSSRIHVAQHLARNSGAAAILNEALAAAQPRRNNTRGLTSVQFLFLMQLTVSLNKLGIVQEMVDVSNALPESIKADMGLPNNLTTSSLYKYTKELGKALDHSLLRAPHLDDDQRNTRINRLDEFVTEYLAATIYRDKKDHGTFAIDAIAIHAPERGTKKPKSDPQEYEEDDASFGILTPQNPIVSVNQRGSKGPSDANWRGKTITNPSGAKRVEWFNGYFANAIASAPIEPQGESDRSQVYSFTLSSAKSDMFSASVRALEQVQKRFKMEDLVADRYYSNLNYDRWFTALNERGINPVNDMMGNQQKFKDFDGMKIAAAWPHCPATPPELGTIPTLGPQAGAEEVVAFRRLTSQRFLYAMGVHTKMKDNKARYICPALMGKVSCTLRGQKNLDTGNSQGRTFIQNPPQGPNLPACCIAENESFTLKIETPEQKSAFRNHQNIYWGSDEWRELYKLRSSIERVFGYAKSAFRLDRNTFDFRGFGLSTVVLTTMFAEINVRKLALWAEEQKHPISHPTLANPYMEEEAAA